MIRLYFYVEGQTEQIYVQKVLAPHLSQYGLVIMGSVLAANSKKHGHVYRGGGWKYGPMREDLGRLLKKDAKPDARFTTMFDLYALYSGFPGWEDAEKVKSDPYKRIELLESAFRDDVADSRFIPHIQLHEFETILLADPTHFALEYENATLGIELLTKAVQAASGPEFVDDGDSTAPSKRIISCFPEYQWQKRSVGPELANCIGLAATRKCCPHFNAWLTTLENLCSHSAEPDTPS